MKTILLHTLLAAAILLFVSCAAETTQAPLFPEYNLGEIKTQSEMADSMASAASNDVDILNNALLTTRQEMAEIRELQDDVSPARLEELEVQLALLTEAFKDLYATVSAIRVLPQIQYAPVQPTRPDGFVVSTATVVFDGDEHDIYSRGMESFRNGFFLESRQLFTAMIEKYPEGRLVDRGHFWIGETYLAEEDYELAVLAFEKAVQFTGSSKQDDALYKQALCYYRSGENDIALQLFGQLSRRFPGSEYVTRANQYIRRLSL